MARLPNRFAPLVYGILQVAVTTAVATAVAVHQSSGLGPAYLWRWLTSWVAAFLMMLPVVVVISPVVKRVVAALTACEPS
jgi:uncharacterized membrane protein